MGGPTFAMADHDDHIHVGYTPTKGPATATSLLEPAQARSVGQAARTGSASSTSRPCRPRPSKFALPDKNAEAVQQRPPRRVVPAPARAGSANVAAVAPLLPFAQLDYAGAIALGDGRYLVRPQGEPRSRIPTCSCCAPWAPYAPARGCGAASRCRSRPSRRRIPLRAEQADPEQGAALRATRPRRRDWLEKVLADERDLRRPRSTRSSASLNRALHAYRVAAPDPYAADLDAGRRDRGPLRLRQRRRGRRGALARRDGAAGAATAERPGRDRRRGRGPGADRRGARRPRAGRPRRSPCSSTPSAMRRRAGPISPRSRSASRVEARSRSRRRRRRASSRPPRRTCASAPSTGAEIGSGELARGPASRPPGGPGPQQARLSRSSPRARRRAQLQRAPAAARRRRRRDGRPRRRRRASCAARQDRDPPAALERQLGQARRREDLERGADAEHQVAPARQSSRARSIAATGSISPNRVTSGLTLPGAGGADGDPVVVEERRRPPPAASVTPQLDAGGGRDRAVHLDQLAGAGRRRAGGRCSG